jgi:hypothetical protein
LEGQRGLVKDWPRSASGSVTIKRRKFGFNGHSGHFVVNPQYESEWDFKSGLAKVTVGKGNDAKTGYIDKRGKQSGSHPTENAAQNGTGATRSYHVTLKVHERKPPLLKWTMDPSRSVAAQLGRSAGRSG